MQTYNANQTALKEDKFFDKLHAKGSIKIHSMACFIV